MPDYGDIDWADLTANVRAIEGGYVRCFDCRRRKKYDPSVVVATSNDPERDGWEEYVGFGWTCPVCQEAWANS